MLYRGKMQTGSLTTLPRKTNRFKSVVVGYYSSISCYKLAYSLLLMSRRQSILIISQGLVITLKTSTAFTVVPKMRWTL